MTVKKTALSGLIVSMLLAGLLSLSGVPSGVFCQTADTAGIGVSDYEKNVTVTQGTSESFEVARVSNEGTLGLTVTAKWKPINYTSGITLMLTPSTVHLNSGEAMLVTAQVTQAMQIGVYDGTIEFSTVVDSQDGGNPSSPAGTAHATFNVVSATQNGIIQLDVTWVLVFAGVVLGVVAFVIVYRVQKQRGKQ